MACGSSLDEHEIDFGKYDTVVGINRLYQTKYFRHMHVLYDAAHYQFDPVTPEKVDIMNSSGLKLWILTPGINTYNMMDRSHLERCNINHFISEDRFYAPKVRITLGIYVLRDVLGEAPALMDVYGFDFYTKGYAGGLKQMDTREKIDDLYNLERQRFFLQKMLMDNPNVRKF